MNYENISILIVDDEESIVSLLDTYLSELGYRISGFSDSVLALEAIKKQDFDLILTDLKMPEVSGLDIVNAVKSKGADTQIIIFTGYASIDSAIQAIQQGVYDYLRKPFKLAEIKIVINRAAEKLMLKRQNIQLQKRIKEMLDDITMLFDISSLLYQVPDFALSLDMIIDTLTASTQVKQAGIIVENNSDHVFSIIKSNGLPKEFISAFKFTHGSSLNSQPIKDSDITIVKNDGNNFLIDDQIIPETGFFTNCILIPIRYFEHTVGYISVFNRNQDNVSIEDELKLLKILATQIAPIFTIRNQLVFKDKQIDTFIDHHIFSDIIEKYQDFKSLTFAGVRIRAEGNNILDINIPQICKSLFEKEFENTGIVLLQYYDTYLFLLKGVNPMDIEFSFEKIRKQFEEKYLNEAMEPVYTLRFSLVTYPLDGKTADKLISKLTHQLSNELSFGLKEEE